MNLLSLSLWNLPTELHGPRSSSVLPSYSVHSWHCLSRSTSQTRVCLRWDQLYVCTTYRAHSWIEGTESPWLPRSEALTHRGDESSGSHFTLFGPPCPLDVQCWISNQLITPHMLYAFKHAEIRMSSLLKFKRSLCITGSKWRFLLLLAFWLAQLADFLVVFSDKSIYGVCVKQSLKEDLRGEWFDERLA